jgi:hypothetical protein
MLVLGDVAAIVYVDEMILYFRQRTQRNLQEVCEFS